MKTELINKFRDYQPKTFLDDIWPTNFEQPQQDGEVCKEEEKSSFPMKILEEDNNEAYGWTDIRKWRIQTLLAISPWGIPLLSFPQVYEKTFHRKFVVQEFGYDFFINMILDRPDIFTVQEPDDFTKLIFPDYQRDKILHDARYGHQFDQDRYSNTDSALDSYDKPDNLNWDELISSAWFNRDDDFPRDVVLAGEDYPDLLLPMSEAKLHDTHGVHKIIIIGVGNPQTIYVNIQSEDTQKVVNLSVDVKDYFAKSGEPIESYRVPREFIYPKFPCLIFIDEDLSWERGRIVGKSKKGDRILVEAVDYGGIRTVSRQQLYLLPRKYFGFAPQAIMVSMFGIKPAFGESKWNSRAGTRLRCFSYPEYYLDCLLIKPTTQLEQRNKETSTSSEKRSKDGLINSASHSTLLSGSKSNEDGENDQIGAVGQQMANMSVTKSSRPLVDLKYRRCPQYEVILCDRNDEDGFKLYLDDILVRETYAIQDEKKLDQMKKLRDELDVAFKNVSRPKNPLVGAFFDESK